MKDFEPKLIVSKGFLDWLNLSGSDPLKTIIHSPIKIFWFLYNKDGLEGAQMKDFDPKFIVSKGFLDWLTLSGSDPLKTVLPTPVPFFEFYIINISWKELIWMIFTQN